MNDKERLQDIKNRFMKHEYDYALSGDDIEWLIKQAERVQVMDEAYQELRKSFKTQTNSAVKGWEEAIRLEKENKRYKRDLEDMGRQLASEHKRIEELEKENEGLKRFYDYWGDLYGEGLEIANWHMNGELEPFDSFFDSAEEELEGGE